jgi:transcriptional regulator with XRE-family HTH domain
MNDMKTFQLDSILAQNNLSFTDLATLVGISRTNLYNYFSDNNSTISVLTKTAEVLNVNIPDLFYNKEVIVKGYLEYEADGYVYIINNIVDLNRFNAKIEEYLNTKNMNQAE